MDFQWYGLKAEFTDTILRSTRWIIGGAAGGLATNAAINDYPLGRQFGLLMALLVVASAVDLFLKYQAKSRE